MQIAEQDNITMTEAAIAHVNKMCEKENKPGFVRFYTETVGCSGLAYRVDFVDAPSESDMPFPITDKITVFVDSASFDALKGTQLDYQKRGLNEGFEFRNPNALGECGCGESFSIEK